MNMSQLIEAAQRHPRLVATLPLDNNESTAIRVYANGPSTSFMVCDHAGGAHDHVFVHTMAVALYIAKTWAGWTS